MIYVDTSVLVASMTKEPGTQRAQAWLAERPVGTVIISDWVATEFSAALSIKVRTGQITPDYRLDALAEFKILVSGSFKILRVLKTHFHDAAQFADRYSLGLRGGDALHLAISAGYGRTLCTLDRRLAEAGDSLGVNTLLL